MKKQSLLFLLCLSSAGLVMADFPDPDSGKTLNARYDFKQFTMTSAYTYDPTAWASETFLDRTVFQYSDGTNVETSGTNSTGGPTSSQGFQLSGNYNFTLNGGNTLSFDWINFINNAKFNIDGAGSKLIVATTPPNGINNNLSLNGATINLTNGAALEFGVNKQIKIWGSTITSASDSTIQGGVSAWHGGSMTLTDSTWTAKGVSLFRYDGNGNFALTLDNSKATLQANNADGTGFNAALELYAHNASATSPLTITLKNKSEYIAGKLNDDGYAVVSGGDAFMGWTSTNNMKIVWDINSGSKFVVGNTTMGRQDASKQADALFQIKVDGTDALTRSSAYFGNVGAALSTSAGSTVDSYKTSIEVGNYADFRATALSLGNISGALNGTSQLTVGSNSTVYVFANGYGGDTNVGGGAARLGGLAKIEMTGNTSEFQTFGIYLGNAGSAGGENRVLINNDTSADATRHLVRAFRIDLRNATALGSTQSNQFIVNGNTFIDGRANVGDTSFRFNIATDAAASGDSLVQLKGANVRFGYLHQLNMGNVASTGGTAKFSLVGSDIKSFGQERLTVADALTVRAGGGMTTILEFVADADGFSLLSANTIDFSGILALDFTDLANEIFGASFLQFRNTGSSLFAGWTDFCNDIVNGNTSRLDITYKNAGDLLEFSYNESDGTLSYTYTFVPEPSTYAAIFGALALAFAAYRRRK